MAEVNQATWKISLWVENDEGLYDMARECRDGDDLEEQFLTLCESSSDFAYQILLDLLGPVNWDEIHERVQDE